MVAIEGREQDDLVAGIHERQARGDERAGRADVDDHLSVRVARHLVVVTHLPGDAVSELVDAVQPRVDRPVLLDRLDRRLLDDRLERMVADGPYPNISV